MKLKVNDREAFIIYQALNGRLAMLKNVATHNGKLKTRIQTTEALIEVLRQDAAEEGSVHDMGASIMPMTTTTASGFCTWEPMPADNAAGNSPTPATTQVISTGRNCSSPVRITALARSKPSSIN